MWWVIAYFTTMIFAWAYFTYLERRGLVTENYGVKAIMSATWPILLVLVIMDCAGELIADGIEWMRGEKP